MIHDSSSVNARAPRVTRRAGQPRDHQMMPMRNLNRASRGLSRRLLLSIASRNIPDDAERACSRTYSSSRVAARIARIICSLSLSLPLPLSHLVFSLAPTSGRALSNSFFGARDITDARTRTYLRRARVKSDPLVVQRT